jgi:hypothetical protein
MQIQHLILIFQSKLGRNNYLPATWQIIFLVHEIDKRKKALECTVHSESIQTPSLFSHFVMLQTYTKIINLHTIPHTDRAKTCDYA